MTLHVQQDWKGDREAANGWREAIQGAGIFVFKRSFKQREISGFSLDDPTFPIIVVNNSTAFTRQIFTMLHELAHLLYGINSVTASDAAHFIGLDKPVEVACNRFAAEILLPSTAVEWKVVAEGDLERHVSDVADKFNVSREVVLRRLLDRQLVTQARYDRLRQKWNKAAEEDAFNSGGGNYYATRAAYLGRPFLDLAFSQYRAGNVTLAELSEHLDMKARNVLKLEDYLLTRA